MSTDPKHPPKGQSHKTPWLDPTAVLTDEEEAALDAIYAQMDPAKVHVADRETHTQHEPTPDDAA